MNTCAQSARPVALDPQLADALRRQLTENDWTRLAERVAAVGRLEQQCRAAGLSPLDRAGVSGALCLVRYLDADGPLEDVPTPLLGHVVTLAPASPRRLGAEDVALLLERATKAHDRLLRQPSAMSRSGWQVLERRIATELDEILTGLEATAGPPVSPAWEPGTLAGALSTEAAAIGGPVWAVLDARWTQWTADGTLARARREDDAVGAISLLAELWAGAPGMPADVRAVCWTLAREWVGAATPGVQTERRGRHVGARILTTLARQHTLSARQMAEVVADLGAEYQGSALDLLRQPELRAVPGGVRRVTAAHLRLRNGGPGTWSDWEIRLLAEQPEGARALLDLLLESPEPVVHRDQGLLALLAYWARTGAPELSAAQRAQLLANPLREVRLRALAALGHPGAGEEVPTVPRRRRAG